MPLNKFIPLSPDPNITRDSDMGMAQFGHLNTIVDYLNTYVAADSLQLDGTGPLSTTLRAITDAAGNLSPLKISTTAVQIVSPLRITTDDPSDMYLDCEDGATNNRFNITRNTASQQVNLNFASNPGGSTSIVGAIRTYVDGVNLSEVMTFREDGRLTIYNTLKSIYDNYSDLGTNAERFANVYALSGRFTNVSTNTLGPLGAATWINISSSVFSLVGGQLSIKGSGSTSATTSLLVQNSGGSQLFKIADDGFTTINGRLYLLGDNIYNSSSQPALGVGNTMYMASNTGIDFSWQNLVQGRFSFTTNVNTNNSVGSPKNSLYTSHTINDGAASSLSEFRSMAVLDTMNMTTFPLTTYIGLFISPTIVSSTTKVRAIQSTIGGAYFNTSSVNTTAILQADSTTQGFLKPRLTTAQKNAIVSPAAGLEVYDTDLNRPCFYSGSAWVTL